MPENPIPAKNVEIPSLTGLRFFAALFVMLSHGSILLLKFQGKAYPFAAWFGELAGIGMSLFFVLSGFVIHYNYFNALRNFGWRSLRAFFQARFARLYPLFFLVLATDVWWGFSGYGKITSYGHWYWAQPLPYYIFMVQSWVYGIIGEHNIIYQIANDIPLTWSISTEWFFYCAYPALVMGFVVLRNLKIAAALTIVYCLATVWALHYSLNFMGVWNAWGVVHFGPLASLDKPQDSFLRWLYYFSPYSRISEFMLGCLTCHCVLLARDVPVGKWENIAGQVIQIATVLGAFFVYNGFLGLPFTWVFGLAPFMAVVIFCCARYDTAFNRLMGFKLIVLGGEISYGMYLLHFMVFLPLSQFAPPARTPGTEAHEIARLLGAICVVLFMAWLVFRHFETPMRRLIRGITTATMGSPRLYGSLVLRLGSALILLHVALVIITKVATVI